MCTGVLSAHMSVHYVCVQCPWKPEEDNDAAVNTILGLKILSVHTVKQEEESLLNIIFFKA